MTLLTERYEEEHYSVPEAEPADVLRYLLERNGLSQRDITSELGSESTVSLLLLGTRQLNRDHISRLSQRFRLSPEVFFQPGFSFWSSFCPGIQQLHRNSLDIANVPRNQD